MSRQQKANMGDGRCLNTTENFLVVCCNSCGFSGDAMIFEIPGAQSQRCWFNSNTLISCFQPNIIHGDLEKISNKTNPHFFQPSFFFIISVFRYFPPKNLGDSEKMS